MSTIVVVKKEGTACIAADTLISCGSHTMPAAYQTRATKIIRYGDAYMGLAGACAHDGVLESVFWAR